MRDSIALNDAVRKYPFASERYQRVFNRKAEELGYEFRWSHDSRDYNSIEPGELKVGDVCPTQFSTQLKTDVTRVLQEVEKERRALVDQSARLHEHIPFRAPFEKLKPVEQAAAKILYKKVKPLIDTIEARQHTPQADAQKAWVERYGEPQAKQLLERFRRDQVAGPLYYDERASLLACFPDSEPINGMIDRNISLEEFRRMAAQWPPESEEMRPTTMLTKTDGVIRSHPLAQDPRFREEHLKLAEAMDQLVNLEVQGEKLDSLQRQQFGAWARYFRSGSAQDEARAVQASIDAGESKSLFRVHLGPSESYWADNVKFPYNLQVGVRDAKIQAEMQDSVQQFLEVEQSFADIPNYQPRPVKTRGGFSDPIYQIFCEFPAALLTLQS